MRRNYSSRWLSNGQKKAIGRHLDLILDSYRRRRQRRQRRRRRRRHHQINFDFTERKKLQQMLEKISLSSRDEVASFFSCCKNAETAVICFKNVSFLSISDLRFLCPGKKPL